MAAPATTRDETDDKTGLHLTDAHRAHLRRRGIDPGWALKNGITSVTSIAALIGGNDPALERQFGPHVPGIGHILRSAGPERRLWLTLQPDAPLLDDSGRPRKYVVTEGTGGTIYVPSNRLDLLDRHPETVILVEGIYKIHAVNQALPDDSKVLPVMINGCWGWSKKTEGIADPNPKGVGGHPGEDLGTVVQGAKSVYILMDGDLTTNPMVNYAARSLAHHVKKIAKKGVRVRYVLIPPDGSKGRGVDDYLADEAETPRDRAALVERLLVTATATIPKLKPLPSAEDILGDDPDAEHQEAVDPEVDGNQLVVVPHRRQTGRFRTRETKDGGTISVWEPSTQFSVEIIEAATVEDDLLVGQRFAARSVVYEVELQCADWPTSREPIRALVTEETLQSKGLEGLLAAFGSEGTTARRDDDPRLILQAIRVTGRGREVKRVRRTGYFRTPDGVLGYLAPNGLITRGGQDETFRSELTGSLTDIEVTPASSRSRSEAGDAFRRVWQFMDRRIAKPAAPILALGAHAMALTGHAPEGAYGVVGQFGGGKTMFLNYIASFYKKDWGPMKIIGGTANATAEVGRGMHNALYVLDDSRKTKSTRRTEDGLQGLSDLIRRTVNGPEAGRDRLTKDGLERPVRGEVRSLLFGGEFLDMSPETNSDRQRVLAVYLPAGESLLASESRDDNPEFEFKREAADGYTRLATGAFIQWVLVQIEERGGWDAWLAYLDERIEETISAMASALPSAAHRTLKVTAFPVVGYALWMEAAVHYGAFSEDDAQRWLGFGIQAVVDTSAEYTARFLTPAGERWRTVLTALDVAVANRRAYWHGSVRPDPKALLVGARNRNVTGTNCTALIPEAVLEVLRGNFGLSLTLDEDDVTDMLQPVLEREKNRDRVQVKIAGRNQRCWVIPEALHDFCASADDAVATKKETDGWD